MKYLKKPTTIVLIIISIFIFFTKTLLFNNVDFLFFVAEGFNQPSKAYHFILGRIYRISLRREIGGLLVDRIKSEKESALHYHYIRVLGVIGYEKATSALLKKFIDNLNNRNHEGGTNNSLCIINSLGLIGDEKIVPVLEKSLIHYNTWLNSSIAAALYLITGEKYEFINTNGEIQEFIPSQESVMAHEIISQERGEKRTYKEMIELDKVFRPPS